MPLQDLHDTPTLQLPEVDFMILATTDDPSPAFGSVETRADTIHVVLAAFVCFHASIAHYMSDACSSEAILWVSTDREVAYSQRRIVESRVEQRTSLLLGEKVTWPQGEDTCPSTIVFRH